jgi:hypothetical protein
MIMSTPSRTAPLATREKYLSDELRSRQHGRWLAASFLVAGVGLGVLGCELLGEEGRGPMEPGCGIVFSAGVYALQNTPGLVRFPDSPDHAIREVRLEGIGCEGRRPFCPVDDQSRAGECFLINVEPTTPRAGPCVVTVEFDYGEPPFVGEIDFVQVPYCEAPQPVPSVLHIPGNDAASVSATRGIASDGGAP